MPSSDAFRFDVAFSFAGAHRDKVRSIANILRARLGDDRVFFDEWFEHEILGSDMDALLQRLYYEQSLMVVADLSDEYGDRPWCQVEGRAIRALRFDIDSARDETKRLRLLDARFGTGSVPGVFNTSGYLDGINKTAEECAELIIKRLELLRYRMEGKFQPLKLIQQSTPDTDSSGRSRVLPTRGLDTVYAKCPARPPLIVGRDNALADLRRMLRLDSTRHVVAAVHGWPGVGKSTLVAEILHDDEVRSKYPDAMLWVSLGQTPDILGELSRLLYSLLGPARPSPRSAVEAAEALSAILRTKRALLIIDDVWEPEAAAAFAVGGDMCATIITTRDLRIAELMATTPSRVYRLDVLSADDAYLLLSTLAPDVVSDNPDACRRLLKELERLPLAIQVAGRLLHSESTRGWNVTDLLRELTDATALLKHKVPPSMAILTNQTSLTVAALLLKSTDRLNPPLRLRFAYLAAFAAKPATFDLAAIERVWATSRADTKCCVDELVDRGLLEPLGNARFWMHALLVAHATGLCED